MSNVLFLVHRIPFPPDKGDKIRSYNLLRHLQERHKIYLGGFVDREEDWKHVAELEAFCEEIKFRRIGRLRSRLSAMSSLLRRRPLSNGFYSDRALKEWVNGLAASIQFDLVVAFSSTMAQFLPTVVSEKTFVLADFVDLDSDKWKQYALESRWPMSSVYAYEARALAAWEHKVMGKVDAVTLVSDEERRLAMRQFGSDAGNVAVIRNGVNTEFFDPELRGERPFEANRPIVLFTGAMDYFANVRGVTWFAEEIWPLVRKALPDAEFWVVGSNPTKEVEALGAAPGVVVTGYVTDIRPYLRHADVSVAPLELARGVQNKVLEALAMNLPVVATPQALQGLDGELPDSIASRSDPADFADAVIRTLLEDRDANDNVGREYIRQYYDWYRNLSEIDRLVASWLESNRGGVDASTQSPEAVM